MVLDTRRKLRLTLSPARQVIRHRAVSRHICRITCDLYAVVQLGEVRWVSVCLGVKCVAGKEKGGERGERKGAEGDVQKRRDTGKHSTNRENMERRSREERCATLPFAHTHCVLPSLLSPRGSASDGDDVRRCHTCLCRDIDIHHPPTHPSPSSPPPPHPTTNFPMIN